MKAVTFFVGSLLLALSVNAGANDPVLTTGEQSAEIAKMPAAIDILRVAPCKASGDGTYVEMITTMASVLPPELGDALLARYCEECYKRKFVVSKSR